MGNFGEASGESKDLPGAFVIYVLTDRSRPGRKNGWYGCAAGTSSTIIGLSYVDPYGGHMKNKAMNLQSTMLFVLCMLMPLGIAHAQNDYMYGMRAGAVILKQSIHTADEDSVIFYAPAIPRPASAVYGSMYVMKTGSVVVQQGLGAAEVDSVIFYDPTPALTTTDVSSITYTTAECGGNVTADGGSSVTARGVCWSTSSGPTTALPTKTLNGSGCGTFSSSMTGLMLGTTYFVRAYATNSVGTAYGTEVSFATTALAIGGSYLGGKIAYLDASGIHGFVCSLSEINTGISFDAGMRMVTGGIYKDLEPSGVYGISKSGGRKNTDNIISRLGAGTYAASICAALTTGGAAAGDWYLPSLGELNQINIQKAILGWDYRYACWSSSDYDDVYAWAQVPGGAQTYLTRTNPEAVRAIRAF